MTFGSAGQRGRWRVARFQREAERRRLEARHAVALARHRRSLSRARGAVVRYAIGTVASVVGVIVTAGFAELTWAAAGAACAVETGLWSRKLVLRRRSEPPAAPRLPLAVPSPPPRGSSAWPALRRLETAVTAIRRLAPALPSELVEAARPSVEAARAAYDMGRAQATQIAAAEAALGVAPATDRTDLEQVRAQLLHELDLAAVAVEHLLASCTRLIGARSGYDARGQLSAATADVVARTYGLAAAAQTMPYHSPDPIAEVSQLDD
jgi:hypothetical protein